MATRRESTIRGPLRILFNLGAIGDMTDGQLLERFAQGGEAAELAFAALIERHGPVVLHTCRSILRNEHDAEDAFQATFLTLVRKARSLWVRDSLGPWLHQVACRAARFARSAAIRRTAHERRAAEKASARADSRGYEPGEELGAAIHEEIERIPARYRGPLVLCDLEGRTYEQAARHLGCPVGTVKSRLARGRRHLGDRLTRRSLALPPALSAGGLLPPSARAAPAALLVDATTRAAMQIAAGWPLAEVVSAAVSSVLNTISKEAIMRNLHQITIMATVGTVAGGLAWAALRGAASDPSDPPGNGTSRQAAGEQGTQAGEPEARVATDIRGQWEVLYLTGSVAGKREGYPTPGLVVPVTEETVNLPGLTGNPKDPMTYLGRMPYLLDPEKNLGAIDMKTSGDGKVLRGIYRLKGDILTICIGGPDGARPRTFTCDGPSDSLIVLRQDHPQPIPPPQPGAPLPPPTPSLPPPTS